MNLPVPQLQQLQTEAATTSLWFLISEIQLSANIGHLKITALGWRQAQRWTKELSPGIPGLFPTNVTVLEPFHAGYTLVGNSD